MSGRCSSQVRRARDPAGDRLSGDRMLNVVLVMMVTTAILGPVLTERFATQLLSEVELPQALKATASK